ncbi:general amidase [Sistotremastrum niveocremeum HHB9708]|uniref:amidase n=2 Tax=Sistotremastraceae TaxID=3402574 RepID=A0A164U7Z5_9AGAM|nr:general amidase [Sistotremastrum niveocremeum HHB9708]KZT44330.1 amidase [Sistotremastrum suecicum HHB10207 ss-3]
MTASWEELAANKKRAQAESIPKEWLINTPPDSQLNVSKVPLECGLLSEREVEITELKDVDVLLQRLAASDYSAVEVTTAFYKRAIVAHQLTNCLTEIFIDRALAWARELDESLKKNGKPKGPLHGLPISLKDQLCIEGLDTTMGYISWIGKPASKNAVLVDILLEAGAVPFVRTNVPQTLMWPETFNLIFGRTTNPYNRSLTSGGSSGGEGALIALGGSILGVGSDVGGSVRIPAAFNGLYGLRPSYNRIPYQDAVNSMEGQESIYSVFGPLSPRMSGIKAFTKAVIDSEPWRRDPVAIRKAWDEKAYQLEEHGNGQNLVFGILWDDDWVVPHPPVKRALQRTKDALLKAGHKTVDWKALKHGDIYAVGGAIWAADGGKDFDTTCAPTGEPLISTMLPSSTEDTPEPPAFRQRAKKTAYELWQIHKQKRALRKEYLDSWEATKSVTGTGRPIDAIISPVAPWAPPPHGKNTSAAYTLIWNTLDYAACVFPVTTVNPAIDVVAPPHDFKNKDDQATYELYDPEVFKGAPVGLQVVGRPQEEEAVIALTEIVAAALKGLPE